MDFHVIFFFQTAVIILQSHYLIEVFSKYHLFFSDNRVFLNMHSSWEIPFLFHKADEIRELRIENDFDIWLYYRTWIFGHMIRFNFCIPPFLSTIIFGVILDVDFFSWLYIYIEYLDLAKIACQIYKYFLMFFIRFKHCYSKNFLPNLIRCVYLFKVPE